jgi:hypothetical protein
MNTKWTFNTSAQLEQFLLPHGMRALNGFTGAANAAFDIPQF